MRSNKTNAEGYGQVYENSNNLFFLANALPE